jgi:AhpD family alkylhydroperoxidase
MAALAESPAAVEAYAGLSAIYAKSDFSPAEQQIVLLAASFENNCTYCMAAHSTVAQGAGLSDEARTALREGRSLADARQEALRAFTVDVVRERGFVAPERVQAFIDAGFTRANVLEVITGVALKTISNYANHIIETPVDAAFSAQSWTKPELAPAE